VRVRVDNNGDTVVCEVDEMHRSGGNLTVHFLQEPDVALDRLLPTGAPVDSLTVGSTEYRVSLVDMGNPYVFVRARDLGVHSRDELFADDRQLFEDLVALRRAAAVRWGWPDTSAFPKVAAIEHFTHGQVTVRAVSVPKWHPTLALTGATCLAVATVIPHTIAHEVAVEAGCGADQVRMETPASVITGRPVVVGLPGHQQLSWVSVSGKRARHVARIALDLLPSRLQFGELVA
jgi:2-methylaconitate cis-trans-isomerase PrpF